MQEAEQGGTLVGLHGGECLLIVQESFHGCNRIGDALATVVASGECSPSLHIGVALARYVALRSWGNYLATECPLDGPYCSRFL